MIPYLVKWIDITSDDGWHTPDEAKTFINDKEENIVTQIGFIYKHTKHQLVLIDSWVDHGENILYGGIHKIPTGCIIEIRELVANETKSITQ